MPFGESGWIRIDIAGQFGIDARVRQLATFGNRIESLAPAWEQVGEDLLEDFGTNFDVEGGVFGGSRSYLGAAGGKWKALAKSTVQDRLRHGWGGAHPILVREGDLLESVTRRGAPGNVFAVRDDGLTVGSDWFTAGWHQRGTERRLRNGKTVTMPARPIVGISWNRRSGIVERLNEYVQAQVAASGLESGA